MIAASRGSTAHNVLRRLSAIGAHLECRGGSIVLRAGTRSVPPELIQAARATKAELIKVLRPAESTQIWRDERLRHDEAQKPSVSTSFFEGAHYEPVDHLQTNTSTEDAHLITLEKGADTCGSHCDPASKALKSEWLSTVESDQHLRSIWNDMGEGRTVVRESEVAVPRIGKPELPDEPILLRDGRRLWRFRADTIPEHASGTTVELVKKAQWHGTVLVADGLELIVVKPWLAFLPYEMLGLQQASGEVIALLRRQSRIRCADRERGFEPINRNTIDEQ